VTAPPDEPTSTPFGELPSPLDSVEDLRTAAKWTMGATGAVGTALIGGAPLVAAGQVHGTGHAVLVGTALVVACIGVGLAIWQTSQVLVPPITTTAMLETPTAAEPRWLSWPVTPNWLKTWARKPQGLQKLRHMVDASPADFFGVVATSVDDLLAYRWATVGIANQVRDAEDPARRAVLGAAYQEILRDAERAEPYVGWLLATAHVWQIRAKLRRAQWSLLAGVILVAVGASIFLTVTGQQSGPDYVPVVTTRPTTLPGATPLASPSGR
jgi:hypothetical protein